MRPTLTLTPRRIALAAFAAAATLACIGAVIAVNVIEARSREAVALALAGAGAAWASVQADGLQLHMTGTAPSEAERFRALTVAGSLVDAARLIDGMQVAPAIEISAPRYSVEILRNEQGISVIGLIPSAAGRLAVLESITASAAGAPVTDMLETADYAVPEGWDPAMTFGLNALQALPRSKISISANRVAITAITDSAAEKRRVEADLARDKPARLDLVVTITAPRPVLTPFTLRFLIDDQGTRFDACSADTPEARGTILQAAAAAGMTEAADCVIGLGAPSPAWAQGVATAIAGLAEMGGGALTFSDADISLVAGKAVARADFDRVAGDLEAKLPDVFSLSAVMPEKSAAPQAATGPAEFTATLAEDGRVELRGRLPDDLVRSAVDSFARARFGSEAVYAAARLDDGLPPGWPVRVLSALQALAELDQGSIVVRADTLKVQGVTGNPQGSTNIARILSQELGPGQDFQIIVRYDKALDPNAGLPTPAECAASINAVLTRQKITFAPGKAEIDPASNNTLDGIAKIFARCGALPMEIGGHTDAQGRDAMNLDLSQARAEAVRQALLTRGVLSAALSAQGYGETLPIGDNKTETGREQNRRIEFKLLLSDAEAGRIAAETVAADAAQTNPAADAAQTNPTADAAQANPAADAAQTNPTADAAQADQPVTGGTTSATDGTVPDPAVAVLPAAENQIRPKARPKSFAPPEPVTPPKPATEQAAPVNSLPEQAAPAVTLPEQSAPVSGLPEQGASPPD